MTVSSISSSLSLGANLAQTITSIRGSLLLFLSENGILSGNFVASYALAALNSSLYSRISASFLVNFLLFSPRAIFVRLVNVIVDSVISKDLWKKLMIFRIKIHYFNIMTLLDLITSSHKDYKTKDYP